MKIIIFILGFTFSLTSYCQSQTPQPVWDKTSIMRCLGEELYTCSEDSCSKNKSTLDWTIKFDENEIQINTVLPPRQNNFTLPNKRKILSKTVHYENNVIFLDSGQILTIFPSKTNKYFSSLVSVSDFVRSNGKEIKVLTTYSYKMICE